VLNVNDIVIQFSNCTFHNMEGLRLNINLNFMLLMDKKHINAYVVEAYLQIKSKQLKNYCNQDLGEIVLSHEIPYLLRDPGKRFQMGSNH
jgi:hypothetical protein